MLAGVSAGWAGKRATAPFPAPFLRYQRASYAALRIAPDKFFLTKPNTSSTIEVPASLRSERCSPSARNAVRVPFGISVRLRRNPQLHLAVGGYRGRNIRQLESRESVRSVIDLLKNIGRAYQKL